MDKKVLDSLIDVIGTHAVKEPVLAGVYNLLMDNADKTQDIYPPVPFGYFESVCDVCRRIHLHPS